MAAILHLLQLMLIWFWNTNETYVSIVKHKVPWSLLLEKFLTSFYQFFTKIIIMSKFINVVFGENFSQRSAFPLYEINDN